MFDIPFERVYDCRMEHQKIVLGRINDDDNIYAPEALDRLASYIKAVQDHRFETEHDAECFGWFLSQAPPLYPSAPVLTNKQIESIPQSDQFIHWSKQVTPSFLHLHAPSGVSEVSRQLAQHLNSARLLDNTREYQLTGEIVYFEINDEDITCSKMESMIAYFITVMIARFAFKGMNHLQRMYHQRSWTLHDLLKTFHLIRIGLDSNVFFAVGRLDLCDENSQRHFLRHMKLLTEGFRLRAAMIVTTQGSAESISKYPEDWLRLDIGEVAAEIEASSQPQKKLSKSNPLSEKAAKALSFMSHTLRPLSANELFCLMHLDDGTEITRASYCEISEIVQEINEFSSHTVSLQDNRLEIVGSRDISNEAACHERIFSALLAYLRRPLIQQQIFELCEPYETLLSVANSHPRENLISYAVMYWPIHFRLSRSKESLEETCEFLSDQNVVRTWSEGFLFLSNPITRTDLCYLSPIPLASMLGLEDALSWFLEKLRGSPTFQSDCELALIEAAQHGHNTVAHQLMKAIDIDNLTLGDAISATASYGDFDLLHELVLLASRRYQFEWPSDLLLRISTIGDHKTAEILLDAGMPINPSNPFQGRTPLHLAALNEHEELVRVLLDRKADVECRAQFGRIALATAAYGLAPRSIIKMLIQAGSNIEAEDEDGCTPVQLAIMGGNLPAAEELLAEGADFERGLVEGSNSTANKKALIMCAEDDQLEGTELLLRYKPDVNCLWNKVTPLWIAVNNGNVELCRLLLKHGANPDLNPIGYDMILLRAVEQSSLEIVELLVQNGADIEQEDNSSPWRRTALARAAGNPNEKILKFLLNSEPKADIMHVGEESQTPLFVAGVGEKIENARSLLNAGADPSVPTGESRWLPIHAGYESPEMIQLFLENGCDINSEYANGNLLSLVVSQNREESARFLLTQSPVPNLEIEMADVTYNEDDKGLTPLSYACGTNKHKLTRWLLRVGANTNHRTLFGRLPIDLAVATGSKQALKVLLEYGVPVSASDDEGNAVLHRITEATTRSMVRMLVNAGASVTSENKKGETPLQTAVTASNTPAVRILLSRGADPDQYSKEFYSLLHIACKNRDIQTLKALIKAGANVRRADTLRDAPSLAHAVLNYWDHSGTDPMPALLSYLVEECKCNISSQGGIGDLPLNTACYFNFIPQVQYLLSQGARPDLEDCYGRRALHLASLYPGIKMLDIILDSGADALDGEDPVLDKLGRTPVHFAAVSGNWEVFKKISEIYDEKELHRPDGEGWTPLFWAVFNRETPIEIVQHLVDHGADLWVTVNDVKSEFAFSPLRLGRYIGVREEILELLVPNPPSRLIASTGQEEKWNDHDHTSRKAEERPKVCDSCRVVSFVLSFPMLAGEFLMSFPGHLWHILQLPCLQQARTVLSMLYITQSFPSSC